MQAQTPKTLHPLWIQIHNAGDLDAMMGLCEPEVCGVTWSDSSVSGNEVNSPGYRGGALV